MNKFVLLLLLYDPVLPPVPRGDTLEWPGVLDGMEVYAPSKHTQKIYNQGEETDKVLRITTEAKWHQSGGMLGVEGFTSTVYKSVPGKVENFPKPVRVLTSIGSQVELAVGRKYPVGTRFVDRLKNADGEDFEARLRHKTAQGWVSKVVFTDRAKRPAGYDGLKQSCSSCHDEAGSGLYAAPLVPGDDTVFSDELDWSVLDGLTVGQRKALTGR